MKVVLILVVVVCLGQKQYYARAQECECDCTCPNTESTCDSTDTTTPFGTTPTTTTTTSTTTSTTTTTTTPEPTTTVPTTTTTVPPTTTPEPEPYACGNHFVDPGKNIWFQSPNYPKKYGKKAACNWKFVCTNTAGTIKLTCKPFKTEKHNNCLKADYLKISDKKGALGTYCGKVGPKNLETRNNQLIVKFATDKDAKVDTGFDCNAECTAPTTPAPEPTTPAPTPKPTTTPKPATPPKPTTTPKKTLAPGQTTTPVGGFSGVCSLDLVMSGGMTAIWESPNYDGINTNYPKGDYCCWLNVTVPQPFSLFMTTMTMGTPAKIYETSSCVGDRITYIAFDGTKSTLCGSLSGQSWQDTVAFDAPHRFGFQWCSVNNDGGEALGFQMTIEGTNLGG